MRFLKILLWVLVAVLAIIFAGANWRDVDITLWGGLILTIKLPFLLLLVALIAWLPTISPSCCDRSSPRRSPTCLAS